MGNFFNNLAGKLQTFMMGRNGTDKLALVCLIVAVVVGLINSFVPNLFFTLITWLLLIYSLFRCFSTNVAARQAENEKFENLFSRGKRSSDGSGAGSRNGSRRTSSAYSASSAQQKSTSCAGRSVTDTLTFQCEQCGQKLSVPKGKGTLKITCPKCHHQQKVHS